VWKKKQFNDIDTWVNCSMSLAFSWRMPHTSSWGRHY